MFTGLIQDIGTIRTIDKSRGDWRFEIETRFDTDTIEIGASIACSGCCLTVVEKTEDSFSGDVSAESLDVTTMKAWTQGTRINLEASLKMGDEMGGHIVSGHVDAIAEIMHIEQEGDSHRITIAIPEKYEPYIASKGSVTIDGISLTVNEVSDTIAGANRASFGINVIPHTWDVTTLSDRRVGDFVNLEIDMLARYVARQLAFKD